MPQSKGRQKNTKKRYQLEPQRKKRSKKVSRWYAPAVLSVIGLGVLVVVLNYMALIPFSGGQTKPAFLWLGLILIGAGFIGTMNIR
jgi:hypothetical protein